MSDFYLVNIDRREIISIWNYDCGKVLKDLLSSGWSLNHVINIEFEGLGFTRESMIERGFTPLNG
jgi:hypothetical protein